MLEREKRSTHLLASSNDLRKLILGNPDLPLLVFAGEEANTGEWSYMTCSSCRATVGEFLDCMQEIKDEVCYVDREDFKEALEEAYEDFDGSEQEFEQFIENKLCEYEPYWKPCIILYVDN